MERPIQIPVGFFVIQHPEGNVLFDTGNNDKTIDDPSYWWPHFDALKPVNTPDVAIDTQLHKIGLSPDDIKNTSWSATCTSTTAATSPSSPTRPSSCRRTKSSTRCGPTSRSPVRSSRPTPPCCARLSAATSRTRSTCSCWMTRTLDLFGDGSVVVKSARGHTRGHQMMVVRLPNTGTLVLTGDNVYFRENVEKHLPPAGIMRAYDFIRFMMASEDADFFTAHDPDAFKAMKKAPEFYD
jgi:hypothetical protein